MPYPTALFVENIFAAPALSEKCLQSCQQKQVKGVEKVKGIFALPSPLSVVQRGRNQRQKGCRRAEAVQVQQGAAGQKGRNRKLPEKIAGCQAADAPDAVIGTQKPGGPGESRQEQKPDRAAAGERDGELLRLIQAEKQQQPQQERQTGILMGRIKGTPYSARSKGTSERRAKISRFRI